jgi:hypothetical protein
VGEGRPKSTGILAVPPPVGGFGLGINLMIPSPSPSLGACRRHRGSLFVPRENTKEVEALTKSWGDICELKTQSVFDQKKEIDVLWKKLLVSIPGIIEKPPKTPSVNQLGNSQPLLLESMTVTANPEISRRQTTEISFTISDVFDSQSDKSAQKPKQESPEMQKFTRQLRMENSRNINFLLANRMFLAGQDSHPTLKKDSSNIPGPISKFEKFMSKGNLKSEQNINLDAEASKKSLGLHIKIKKFSEDPGESMPLEFLDKEMVNDNDSNIDSLYQDVENEKIMFEDFDGGAEFDKEILTEEEFRRINNF